MTTDLSDAARPTFHTLTADMMPGRNPGAARKTDAEIRADVALLHANYQKKLAAQMAENGGECVRGEMSVQQTASAAKKPEAVVLKMVS